MRGVRGWLVAAALPLLVLAWSMASAPFSGPDEASHYLRALSIAHGVLVGRHVEDPSPRLTPAMQAFVNRDATAVFADAGEAPPGTGCIDGRPDAHGCLVADPNGDYYPLAYLLPAAVLAVDHHPSSGGWATRVAAALPCMAFLFLAVVALWDGTLLSVAGLLAAVTPMVLFVCSVLNPSGLVTAACLALIAALIRLGRDDGSGGRWLWALIAGSGACTILSWQAGPAFVAIAFVAVEALFGHRLLPARGSRRALVVVGGVLAAALVAWVIYGAASGVGHSQVRFSPVIGALRAGVDQLLAVAHGAIGNFGDLTISLPAWVVGLWLAVVAGLAVGGFWCADRREWIVLAGTIAIGTLFPVLSYAWVYRQSGFALQARHVLPVLVLIPLVAGEIVRRHRPAGAEAAAAAAVALLAGLQAFAWFDNARRSAGSSGLDFLDHPRFVPPAGPWIWVLVAGLACGLLAAAPAGAFPRRRATGRLD